MFVSGKRERQMFVAGKNAGKKKEQAEIFYAVMCAYVQHKLVKKTGVWEKIVTGVWEQIVIRDWSHIISVYAAMLKCCNDEMLFFIDPVLQGDDAKHYLSYVYSRYLDPEVIGKPNELYERCVLVMATLVQDVEEDLLLDESPVAKLVSKFEKLK
jgi:hypothetical protein